jgi:rhodanese-related sulfurtransferase
MKVSILARAALVATATRPTAGFAVGGRSLMVLGGGTLSHRHRAATFSRFMSTTNTEMPSLKHIGREEMQEILDTVEQGETDYVVIDVRNVEEIAFTGPLSPDVKTLPLPLIMQKNVFQLDSEEFEEVCRFSKPEPDATLVFSCAAGVRSVHAANFAAQGGYSKLVNYMGGANEWFNP